MSTTLHDQAMQQMIRAAIENPLDGMAPSFDFGASFDTWWQKLFGAGWGIAVIIALVYFLVAIATMAKAGENNAHEHAAAKKGLIRSGAALGCLLGFGIIVGLIFYLAG